MRTKFFILLLIVSVVVFQFCKVDDGKPEIDAKKYEPVVVPNLITNSSFENAGNIDQSGWLPSTLQVVQQPDNTAPIANGYFCVKLSPDTSNQYNLAYTTITGRSGFTELQLSFYAKTSNCSGYAELRIKRNGYYIRTNKDYNFSFEKWTERILKKDTCTLYPSDTLEILFWANRYNPSVAGSLYIDMVKLYKLN